MIWGVQAAQGGQEGLANQLLGLPVERAARRKKTEKIFYSTFGDMHYK